jgi:outer membrane lipoprotein-sorting protein
MQCFKLYVSTLFFILQSAVSTLAQSYKPVTNSELVKSQIAKKAASTTSIQAHFQEIRTMSVLKSPQYSEGIFYYKKSDQMRWQQAKPNQYIILIDGAKFRIQEDGKEKNIGGANKMASQVKELMIGLVNGDFQYNKSFEQTIGESPDQYQIVLTPLQTRLKKRYARIELYFVKNTLRMKQITFIEKNGDRSEMKFSNEKFNQEISNSLFTNF